MFLPGEASQEKSGVWKRQCYRFREWGVKEGGYRRKCVNRKKEPCGKRVKQVIVGQTNEKNKKFLVVRVQATRTMGKGN